MGCAEWNRTAKGTVIGAGAGVAAGGLIGHATGIWANEKLKKVTQDKTS
jgi:hypothetical protein